LNVPQDISIIGRYDTPWSIECQPQLTTLSINSHASAQSLLHALELMNSDSDAGGGRRILVSPELIVRASTGPASVKLSKLVPKRSRQD